MLRPDEDLSRFVWQPGDVVWLPPVPGSPADLFDRGLIDADGVSIETPSAMAMRRAQEAAKAVKDRG